MAAVHDSVMTSSVWQTPAPERVENFLKHRRIGGQLKEAEFQEALRYSHRDRNQPPYNTFEGASFLINTYNFEEVKHLIETEINPFLEYILNEK